MVNQVLNKLFLKPYIHGDREIYLQMRGLVLLFIGFFVLIVLAMVLTTMQKPLVYSLYGMFALDLLALLLVATGRRTMALQTAVYGFWLLITSLVFFTPYFEWYGVYKMATFYLFLLFVLGLGFKQKGTTLVLATISVVAMAADYAMRLQSDTRMPPVEAADYITCASLLIFTALIIYTLISRGTRLLDAARHEAAESQRRANDLDVANQALVQRRGELRVLRNYLSNIIDSMPSVLVSVNERGEVTQWNREAAIQTGTSADAAMGQPLQQVMPGLGNRFRRIETAMAENTIVVNNREVVKNGDDIRYENMTVYPLREDGNPGAVIRLDDVTEQVHLEERIVQNEKMQSVGGLAAGMAHEINNPLAGMLQNTMVIQSRLQQSLPANTEAAKQAGVELERVTAYLEDRNIFKMLDMVAQSGRRAAAIVQNMLSFSRKSTSVPQPASLQDLMEQSLTLASTDYDLGNNQDFRKIAIVRDYDEEIPSVLCEPAKIQQVMINLLRNGAHAMHEGRAAGTVAAEPLFSLRTFREDQVVGFEIEDNGPGIPKSTHRRIFEPFFTTKSVGEGTGLGLAVSFFIITEQHKGTMAVESSPGLGTKFTIRLPLNL